MLLNFCDSQLFLNREGVEKIAAKNERVARCVDRVNPPGGDEQRVAAVQDDAAAFLHHVAEENVGLFAGQRPFFICLNKEQDKLSCKIVLFNLKKSFYNI